MNGWDFEPTAPNTACESCGRIRMTLCVNGKQRCEKCDYSPELGRKVTDEELDDE